MVKVEEGHDDDDDFVPDAMSGFVFGGDTRKTSKTKPKKKYQN